MKKLTIALSFSFIAIVSFSQERYFTKSGKISFYSSTPMEDIEAINKNAVSVFDKTTGQIEVSTLMKGFEFQKALMQEHFNENYMESDKFPKAVFKGKINDISNIDFTKAGQYSTTVTGKLSLHGVTKDITAPITFNVSQGNISASAEFKVLPPDFKISIPDLVREKIAKEIKINVSAGYEILKN